MCVRYVHRGLLAPQGLWAPGQSQGVALTGQCQGFGQLCVYTFCTTSQKQGTSAGVVAQW